MTDDTNFSDDERLRALKRRVETDPPPAALDVDAAWPSIRARIEAAKVEQLGGGGAAAPHRARRRFIRPATLAAAALIVAALLLVFRNRDTGSGDDRFAVGTDTGSLFTTVSDSARAYEEETRALLNQLELQRSMLRPTAVAAIDHDLRVVDSAIAEVKDALRRDPNNPALRRLLASSYREKRDVLRRVGNSG